MDKRIWIIGDDENTQALLLQTFSCPGLRASVISNRRSIVLQLFLSQPDLIILDVRASTPSKWATLQQIRELSTVPIIVLAISKDSRIRIEGLDRGADYVVSKPFDTRELHARVRALLRREQRAIRSTSQIQAIVG